MYWTQGNNKTSSKCIKLWKLLLKAARGYIASGGEVFAAVLGGCHAKAALEATVKGTHAFKPGAHGGVDHRRFPHEQVGGVSAAQRVNVFCDRTAKASIEHMRKPAFTVPEFQRQAF